MSNHNKLAVVTGAANGIGAGLSREASRRGFRVLMADFDEAALTKTAAEIQDAEILVTDVSNPNEVDSLADFADSLGGTDLLFNNAGVMSTGFSWEIPVATWERDISVNIGGIINAARSFIPRMIARSTPSRIVNTSSVGGFFPSPQMASYSATKFAVVAITEAMMSELQMLDAPVTVSLLAPGPVKSELFRGPFAGDTHPATRGVVDYLVKLSAEHGMEPDEFAGLVFDAIERDEYWIIPQPERLDARLQKRFEMIRDRHKPRKAKVP